MLMGHTCASIVSYFGQGKHNCGKEIGVRYFSGNLRNGYFSKGVLVL